MGARYCRHTGTEAWVEGVGGRRRGWGPSEESWGDRSESQKPFSTSNSFFHCASSFLSFIYIIFNLSYSTFIGYLTPGAPFSCLRSLSPFVTIDVDYPIFLRALSCHHYYLFCHFHFIINCISEGTGDVMIGKVLLRLVG